MIEHDDQEVEVSEAAREWLNRLSAASGSSPDLRTDPRARRCDCGNLLYPGEICPCKLEELRDD